MQAKRLVTPKQVAQAIGVSESSLKRWCDRGLLPTVRTAGGHRRLAIEQVLAFLREKGHSLVRPELLGLPSNTGQGGTVVDRAQQPLLEALVLGDEERCRRIVFDLHLAGQSASAIGDRVVAEAFREIGERWSCGQTQVYQERRACEICLRVLGELRATLPPPAPEAAVAIGGAPECDPYMLPTALVEIVLRQLGWRAQSLGSRLPFATLAAAVEELKPDIFWLSVSHIDDEAWFVEGYREFQRKVGSEVAIVVGGRALVEPVRRQIEYAAYCDNLQHLEAFAKSWQRSAKAKRAVAPNVG